MFLSVVGESYRGILLYVVIKHLEQGIYFGIRDIETRCFMEGVETWNKNGHISFKFQWLSNKSPVPLICSCDSRVASRECNFVRNRTSILDLVYQ